MWLILKVGQSNKSYNNVCPADLSNEFLLGYTPYYNLASAESDQNTFESNVNYYVSQLGDGNLSDRDRQNYTANLKSTTSFPDIKAHNLVVLFHSNTNTTESYIHSGPHRIQLTRLCPRMS